MINRLSINNFKCFDELNLEMTSLNVLTGINSMGKSSAIQPLLLLRQALEMNSLCEGIHLNGTLVKIGTGYDFMNRDADEEMVRFELDINGDIIFWQYKYDKESDYQVVDNTNSTLLDYSDVNLFKPTFAYISADRIGPKRFYEQSFHEIHQLNQLGVKGELYVDYLAERGFSDKVLNKTVLHDSTEADGLIYQTEAWLSEISPGIKLNPKKYQDAGIVGIEYDVSKEKFSPMNVGFGLSYVAPIVVSLLKAERDDLIILENPEAHLHPKGQRIMGELIARASAGGVQIIVETHSDHVLNGIRLAVKNKIISRTDVRLNYFYQEMIGEQKINNKIIHKKSSPAILEDGRLSDWPEGFFDEWDKALDELF